ncbi:MAG TPA: DUF6174 domain-containing protein [Longimicrobium sp.]|jgi:uncharacterized lipoprotein
MRLKLVLLCIALMSIAGCSRDTTAAQGESDYQYDFQKICFCGSQVTAPVTIHVRGGKVARVYKRPGGEDVTSLPNAQWPTIEDLVRIEEARRNGEKNLIVRYDAELGYPTYIEIGTIANDAGVVYTAENLRYLR